MWTLTLYSEKMIISKPHQHISDQPVGLLLHQHISDQPVGLLSTPIYKDTQKIIFLYIYDTISKPSEVTTYMYDTDDPMPLSSLIEMPDPTDPTDIPYDPLIQRAGNSPTMRSSAGCRDTIQAKAKAATMMLAHGLEVEVDADDSSKARRGFHHITNEDGIGIPLTSPAVVLKLAALLSEYDHEVVQDAEQIRRYTINRLLEESGPTMPAGTRLQALKHLGTITEVGLFSERTEIVVKTLPMDQLEIELHKRLITLLPDEYKQIADD